MAQGTVTVQEILDRVETILQDSTNVRWTVEELVWWLNDSYRTIIGFRPDANSDVATLTCAAGTRQNLVPDVPGATRLLDVVRNLAGTSNEGAIRQIDRSILDDQRRTWHAEAGVVDIEHFAFDPRLPTGFLVYPPALATAEVEVVYSAVPTGHVTGGVSDEIKIDDSFVGPIVDYMLYRAYSKDAEYTANMNRAAGHYQAMQSALGMQVEAHAASNPKDVPATRMINPQQPT